MDTKKKRNKKKKGNQSKNPDENNPNTEETVMQIQNAQVSVSTEEVAPPDHDMESDAKQPIENSHVSASTEAVVLPDHDKESNAFQNGSGSDNSDKSGFVIIESNKELDKHNICEENFVKLQETVTKLENEKNSWIQKSLNLEDQIQKMQDKIETYVQNEVYLGKKLQMMHDENNMLAKKQVTLEDKFERIEDIKYSWSIKEASLNTTISWLEEGNKVLQIRVNELEKSTNKTREENKKLIETSSFLESRIEALEAKSSNETFKNNDKKVLEEINGLDQHSTDFKDLHKKLNEPDTDHQTTRNPYEISQNDLNKDRNLDSVPSLVQNLNQTDENIQVPLIEESSNGTITIDIDQVEKLGLQLQAPSEQLMHDKLHDVEINEEKEGLEISSEDSTGGLPLSDAPLIGAPFRLFSFVAKFVAGSDLVNQTGSASGN